MRCNNACKLHGGEDAGTRTGYQDGGYLRIKDGGKSKFHNGRSQPRGLDNLRLPVPHRWDHREVTTQVTAEPSSVDEWKVVTPKKRHRDTPPPQPAEDAVM